MAPPTLTAYNRWPNLRREFRLHLTSLHIAGFKSFARPVMLEFPSGITAFVGANGSGKSNVVDAIRWCLGEQNARDLRGQRAEDVIHAGRKRVLGSAEVTLRFEGNQAPGSELTIARRILRSGESDYMINGARRRLRDVQSTLSSLGMDHPRFVVVTQGMTDFLLSATGSERRALLEQAAGLSSYRQRRDEASSKLFACEQNIVTAEVVLAELEPRLRSLQRQVRAIEARDALAARLHRRQTLWFQIRRTELEVLRDEAAGAASKAEVERRTARVNLDALEREAQGAIELERDWQRRVEVAAAALHLAQRELDGCLHRVSSLERQVGDTARRRNDLAARLSEFGGEIEAARLRCRAADVDCEDAQRQLAAAREREQMCVERLRALKAELDESLWTLAQVRSSAARLMEEHAGAVSLARSLEGEMTEIDARLLRLEARAAEADRELDGVVRTQEAAAERECEARGALESVEVRAGRLADEVQSIEARIRKAERLARSVAEDRRAIEARRQTVQRSFESLQREMEGTALSALEVEPGLERAIDAAIGAWRSDFRSALEDSDGYVQWRASIAQKLPEGVRWADDLVRSDKDLPVGLLSTVVAGDMEGAERLWDSLSLLAAHRIGSPPFQVVTLEGALVTAHGSRPHGADDRGAQFLTTRNHLASLDRSVRRHTRNEDRIRAVSGRLSARHPDLLNQQRQAAALRDAAEATLLQAAGDREAAGRRRARLERERQESLEACAGARASRGEVEQRLAALQPRLAQLSAGTDQAGRAQKEAEIRAEESRAAVQGAQNDAAEARNEAAIVARRAESLIELAAAAAAALARLQAEPERVRRDLTIVSADRDRQTAELEALRREGDDLAAAVAESEQHLARIRMERPLSVEWGAQLRCTRDISDRALARHEQAMARLREVEGARNRLEEEIRAEMGTSDLDHVDPAGEALPTEDEIRRLRARVTQHTDDDPAVVGEHRELSERRQYLAAQIADLKEAGGGLRQVMTLADAEMRTRFADALACVNEEFNRVFRIMLRGGEATLVESDEGGIEVRASLPGKRVRSSAAFSGGERALVASALLFGVLRIRPAPFCVLDEVDAALDETNVDRYLDALRELSERTQVLVVTHNRATMAAATALYGLTMDSDGASNVLSLRLDGYDAVS